MTNPIFNVPEAFLTPAVALSKLALNTTERVVNLQFDAARKYTNVALASWKQALEVKDLPGVQKYLTAQGEVLKETSGDLLNDAKAVAEIGKEGIREAQTLITGNVAKLNKKAA